MEGQLTQPYLIDCSACGNRVSNHAPYCPRCGHNLAATHIYHPADYSIQDLFCSRCGRQLILNSKYCSYCSQPITTNQQTSESEKLNDSPIRKVSFPLILGVTFMPYIFSWYTLQKGYSNKARVISLLWMAYIVIAFGSSLVSYQKTDSANSEAVIGLPKPAIITTESTDVQQSSQTELPTRVVARGKAIYTRIQGKYGFPVDVGETAFYHITKSTCVNVNIPTQEWKRLSKEEQICLTYYAESLIPIVRAEPAKYANAWMRYAKWESSQFSGIVNGIQNLCDDCWCVVYGKLVRENGIYDMIEDDRICGNTAASFREK